jgi:hypothetical protein
MNTIIGYIHICQKGDWTRSLRMLMDSIKQSGLYQQTSVIRLGVLNDTGVLKEDEILNDSKFQIVYIGKSAEYERPTLLHMRKSAENDDAENTMYYYLHTKGIKHFGTNLEACVVDWINCMLYWNIEEWRYAVEQLKTYATYGCMDNGHYYSGNFWWARRDHIVKLPNTIKPEYMAPETWIQTVRNNKFSAYNSPYKGTASYRNRLPRENYVKKKSD